jgi:hypothetical protein
MASELLIGPGVTLEYCQALADEIPFSRFEEVYSGEIGIGETIFKMRVGLYLNRPMQVLIAYRQFIKMRPEDRFSKSMLVPLNPMNPDGALYSKCWSPDAGTFWDKAKDSIIFEYAPSINKLLARRK